MERAKGKGQSFFSEKKSRENEVLSVGPYDTTRQLDWVAKISGPHGSLYEKGVFTLDLFFSDESPGPKSPNSAENTPNRI